MLMHVFYISFANDGKVQNALTIQFHNDLWLLDAIWDTNTTSFIWWYSLYLLAYLVNIYNNKAKYEHWKTNHSLDLVYKRSE